MIVSSSSDWPEFESASTTSSRVIMPRSPWLASAACRKNAGVPVLARVEAILRAMCPDLPTPLTTTRPRAREDQADRIEKALVEPRGERAHRVGLDRKHLARELERLRSTSLFSTDRSSHEIALVGLRGTLYDRPESIPDRPSDPAISTK